MFDESHLKSLERDTTTTPTLAKLLRYMPSILQVILHANMILKNGDRSAGIVANILTSVRQFVNGEKDNEMRSDMMPALLLRRNTSSVIPESEKEKELKIYFR